MCRIPSIQESLNIHIKKHFIMNGPRIQGELNIQTFLGYSCESKKVYSGRIIGLSNGKTMETWGFDNGLIGVLTYTLMANGIVLGRFNDGIFEEDSERTRLAREKIKLVAPRIFFKGTFFVQKVDGVEELRYEPLNHIAERYGTDDYLFGNEVAVKFRKEFLGDKKYNERAFLDEIRNGNISWFEKAPTKEHTKNRKSESERRRSVMTGKIRLFRLEELIRERQIL